MYACRVDDIPLGEGRAITLDGRRIAIFRAGGGWYALDAVCPHRGGPLADGIVCDRAVICPLHDRRFDLASGAALTPATPSPRTPSRSAASACSSRSRRRERVAA